MTEIPGQFHLTTQPIAHPEAVVKAPEARFTVLTSRLIRMEYNPGDRFEDRPSQIFWYRNQPVPEFEAKRTSRGLDIKTEYLHLRYQVGERFSHDTLTVEIMRPGKPSVQWHYGDPDVENLKGTTRTLDRGDGPVPLEPGLVSLAGWTVIDDTHSLVFNLDGWLEERGFPAGYQDIYLLAYGMDYADCLRDYYRVSGPPGLIPRWALGNWWSRFWPYRQDELAGLMMSFREHEVPLSVCIIDMDWHITQTDNESSGWTGYTWNKDLFPDPPWLLTLLHNLGLHTALNLHPAEGVHSHEAMYPRMAEAMGIDPASKEPVRFDPENPRFVKAYFDILHHPQEESGPDGRGGVDFWWLDWQQGNPSRLTGLSVLWWINHLHYFDLSREPRKRSFIFSRWGGLGNQRYPIGFSGDTVMSWASLAFQPYMTATAANVGYGWWSHDIGGHMSGIEDAELYTRWVQFGVFSPIFRLHSTQNPYHERRPWGYDSETYLISREAMQLRHALIPYLYSMAWRDRSQGVPLVRPMYHLIPDREEAYVCPNQYTFGSELIAAPFITPRDPDTRLSRQVVWLPPGEWFHFFTGEYLQGDRWKAIYGGLDEIPVFAKAGAIIPLGPVAGWGGVDNPESLVVHVFPGAGNRLDLYEDDGVSQAYLSGAYRVIPMVQEWSVSELGTRLSFRIGPCEYGDQAKAESLLPDHHNYQLAFHALLELREVSFNINAEPVHCLTQYDENRHLLTVSEISLRPTDSLEVVLVSLGLAKDGGALKEALKLVKAFRLGTDVKKALADRLQGMPGDPAVFGAFQVALARSQMRALLEVTTDVGLEHANSSGEEMVIFWNNQVRMDADFLISVESLDGSWREDRFRQESGPVPRFRVVRLEKEYYSTRRNRYYPVTFQLNYNNLLKIITKNQGERSFPRLKTEMY